MHFGQGIGKWAGWTALVLAISSIATPAAADTAPITAYYHDSALIGYTYATNNTNAIIAIDVKASVGGTCGFATNGAPNGSINAGAIDTTGWSAQIPFVAECTAPWRIAVSSLNGSLKSVAAAPTGYANAAPYSVALNVTSDSGTVTSSCPVAQIDQALSSSSCNFKGTATTTNGLQIPRSFGLSGSYIQMSAPSYNGNNGTSILVAGAYGDTLTVTVSPAV
jgi:hypothetical protein